MSAVGRGTDSGTALKYISTKTANIEGSKVETFSFGLYHLLYLRFGY